MTGFLFRDNGNDGANKEQHLCCCLYFALLYRPVVNSSLPSVLRSQPRGMSWERHHPCANGKCEILTRDLFKFQVEV